MLAPTYALAADAVLLAHATIILFNVAALVVIPVGAWRQWTVVRIFWLRLAHLLLMAAVALQASTGRACFLTYWEAALAARAGESSSTMPLIQRWLTDLIYWPVPVWVFAVIYALALAYCCALWWLVPPHRARAAS